MTNAPDSSTKATLIAELGHGGMADVFLAMRRGVGGFVKLLVVKRLRARFGDEPEFLTMFVDEARLAARLNHTNVVQTHEIAVDGGRYLLEMEYLDGQPLHRIVHRARQGGRPMRPALVRKIVCDALAGLHYAHELRDYDGTPMSVVHRDVSPHNVFVTYQGIVKLVDFGIAKAAGQLSVTTIGSVKGKAHYMSPEHATGQRVDRRTDVFAAGVVLWELLTGRRYWDGASHEEVIHRLAMQLLPPSPRVVNARVPEDLDRVVARATAPDVGERYATAEELRHALEACLPGETTDARELGELTSQLFEVERHQVRALIESAVQRTQTEADAASSSLLDRSASTEGITLGPPPSLPTRAPVRRARHRVAIMGATALMLALGAGGLLVQGRGDPGPLRAGRAVEPPTARAAAELAAAESDVPRTDPTPPGRPAAPPPAHPRLASRQVSVPAADAPSRDAVTRDAVARDAVARDAGIPLELPTRGRKPPAVDLTEDPWDSGARL